MLLLAYLCIQLFVLLLHIERRVNGESNTEFKRSNQTDENQRAKEWIMLYNGRAEKFYYENTIAHWNKTVDIQPDNLQQANEADADLSLFQQEAAQNASDFNISLIEDLETKRLLKKIGTVGIHLNATDSLAVSALGANMTGTYSTATVCSMNEEHVVDCSEQWPLHPRLEQIMAKSRDYELLQYVWESWRNVSGRPISGAYEEFVQLNNRGAKAGGFEDIGAWWRSWYEDGCFQEEIERLWYQLLPLYEQLYTYVRKALRERVYRNRIKNVLPAHVLGNMWAQDWSNIFEITRPYPNKTSIDITENMVAQNYTPLRMFQLADEFFQSLGLIGLPESFYKHSVIEKPSDRKVSCHPSAWDFYNGLDYRIHTCTRVNMFHFVIIHHEVGHVQYYLQYAQHPLAFREGANPGFHEAIGDTVALSVSTPKHLQKLGLLDTYEPDHEQDINYLYKMALSSVAFLPFGYLIDLWRTNVFNGKYTEETWNEDWWKLRYKYQGLRPPCNRSKDDFDAGAKFHVPANIAYLRYFVASMLQFQFYEAMCKATNHTGPLYQCDFYQNKPAGRVLANVMKMGSSKPWRDVIEAATGSRNMSAQPLLDYFQPLFRWLQKKNEGECFGWGYEWPEPVMKNLSPNRCTAD